MHTDNSSDEVSGELEFSFQVFDIEAFLSIQTQDYVDALKKLRLGVSQLNRLHDRPSRGMRFVLSMPSDVDECEVVQLGYLKLLGENVASQYWRCAFPLSIVANDADLARKRFEAVQHWIAELSERDYPNFEKLRLLPPLSTDGMTPSHRSVDRSVVNLVYPFAEDWTALNTDACLGTAEIEEVLRRDIWESLGIKTDTLKDAVDSLDFASGLVPQVLEDSSRWKWVFISLHNALQGFMVNALVDTDFRRVQKVGKDENQLQDFLTLYSRIKEDSWMQPLTISKTFKPKGTQGTSIKQLNRFRNEFTHFTAKGWRIDPTIVQDFPLIVDDCTEVISFLALESNNVSWYQNYELQDKTKELLRNLVQSAELISRTYYARAVEIVGKNEARQFLLPRLKMSN